MLCCVVLVWVRLLLLETILLFARIHLWTLYSIQCFWGRRLVVGCVFSCGDRHTRAHFPCKCVILFRISRPNDTAEIMKGLRANRFMLWAFLYGTISFLFSLFRSNFLHRCSASTIAIAAISVLVVYNKQSKASNFVVVTTVISSSTTTATATFIAVVVLHSPDFAFILFLKLSQTEIQCSSDLCRHSCMNGVTS